MENESVVQSATATATAAANSTVLVAVSQSAPSNGFNGNAILAVGAEATPTGGGTPFTMKLEAMVHVGSTSTEILIALAGSSQNMSTQPSPPCIGTGSCFGVPAGAAVVWPQNVTPPVSGVWYAIFQTGSWHGVIRRVKYTLTEQGATVMTYGPYFVNGVVIGENSIFEASAAQPLVVPNNGYTGLAILAVTAFAHPGESGPQTYLEYKVPIWVLPTPTE